MKIYNGSNIYNFYDVENCVFYCIESRIVYLDMPIEKLHYLLYYIDNQRK